MVGDDYLRDMDSSLSAFIHEQFNVNTYYGGSAIGLNKMITPLIHAFNERKEKPMPKYIVMVPDKDFFVILKKNKFETGIVMGVALHYVVKQIDILIDRWLKDVMNKRPGTTIPNHPKVVWIRMLKRPQNIESPSIKHAQSLWGKFNSLLEEQLLDGAADRHCIMSIEVNTEEFNRWRDLAPLGKSSFWSEVDRRIQKFDSGDITLKPRNFLKKKTKTEFHKASKFISKALKQHKSSEIRRKLKTPLPVAAK